MPTQRKRSADSSQHISRIRIASFACGTIRLSKRESAHFDGCMDCRSALREVMHNMLVPVYDVLKRAA